MRIVGGAFRGRRLADLGAGDPAAHLRPTSDRVREALFNVLFSMGDPVPGAHVLDLFAGTGALGLEALSRGAANAVFVDDGLTSRALLRENIAKCRAQGQSKVFRRDATKLGAARRAFDLIFLDPPYGQGLGEAALTSAQAGGWVAPGALIVWEDNRAMSAAGFAPRDQRRYGDTWISILAASL
ncbi:MAG: 16S rRNA (guanine(966)-N(2))-methyltransferase RsmD [Pseudomonadota bacterium]